MGGGWWMGGGGGGGSDVKVGCTIYWKFSPLKGPGPGVCTYPIFRSHSISVHEI